jgi:hypothetical protein
MKVQLLTNMKDLNLQSNPSMMMSKKELLGLRRLQVISNCCLQIAGPNISMQEMGCIVSMSSVSL